MFQKWQKNVFDEIILNHVQKSGLSVLFVILKGN